MISDDFGMIPVKLRLLRFFGQLGLFWETVEFVLDDHSMMLLSLGQQSLEGSKPGNCLAIWSSDGGTWLIVVGNVFWCVLLSTFLDEQSSNPSPPKWHKHFIHMGHEALRNMCSFDSKNSMGHPWLAGTPRSATRGWFWWGATTVFSAHRKSA